LRLTSETGVYGSLSGAEIKPSFLHINPLWHAIAPLPNLSNLNAIAQL